MPNIPLENPGDWKTKNYDSFMIREKELNQSTKGTGSALQQGLQVTQFPDGSIDASSLKAGSLIGDFKVANGSIASRDYSKLGTGWSLDSDGTVHGITGVNVCSIALYDSSTTLSTGNGIVGIAIPAALNGKNLTATLAAISTIGSVGTTTIQIRRRRGGVNADMLSTRITVSYNEYYATDGIIDTSNDDVITGDLIFIDIDGVATGVSGLSVVLTFN